MFSRPNQGSGGASQPAGSSGGASQPADASQLGGLPTVQLRLGCFNCGMIQDMVPHRKHTDNLKRVIGKGVFEQDLHMVTLCEVGGHKQGLPPMCAQDLVSEVLSPHYKAISCQAYMATWQATAGRRHRRHLDAVGRARRRRVVFPGNGAAARCHGFRHCCCGAS